MDEDDANDIGSADSPCPDRGIQRSESKRGGSCAQNKGTSIPVPVSRPAAITVDSTDSQVQIGNAFARKKSRDMEGSKLPRLSASFPSPPTPISPVTPTNTFDDSPRPSVARKRSNLEYDEDLALPMPKPRHPKAVTKKDTSPPEKNDLKSPTPKTRAATDPEKVNAAAASSPTAPAPTPETKKLSAFGKLRSKFSFKDLRKESEKVSSNQTAKNRVVTAPASPAFSSSIQSSKSKEKAKLEWKKASSSNSPATEPSPKTSLSTVRMPSPPVSCVNAQGTMIPTKIPVARRSQASEICSKSPVDSTETKTSSKSSPSATPGGQKDEVPGAWPTTPIPKKSSHGRNYSDGHPVQPVTNDRVSSDHEEGKIELSPFSHEERGSSSTSQIPTFRERLEKANIHPDKRNTLGTNGCNTPGEVNEIVDMVRAIQRQADSQIATMSGRVEELSGWIGSQLKGQIESISDLDRANADLLGKQADLSREIMKVQLDIRLQISTLERRMNVFEHKMLNEIQTEVRSLALSYENLDKRTALLVEKETIAFNHNQAFMDQQLEKNAEIEKEIEYMKSRLESKTPLSLTLRNKSSYDVLRPRKSSSSMTSTDPLIRKPIPVVVRPLPSGGPHPLLLSRAANRSDTTPNLTSTDKPTGILPRSMSFSKRGLLKNIKELSSSDLKENASDKRSSTDENKRWSIFGMRRNHDSPENAKQGGVRLPWSGSRQFKKQPGSEEIASSRSSTPPVPPIPRQLTYAGDREPTPPPGAHPAFQDYESLLGDSESGPYAIARPAKRASLPKKVSRSFDVSRTFDVSSLENAAESRLLSNAKSTDDRPATAHPSVPAAGPLTLNPVNKEQNTGHKEQNDDALANSLLTEEWDRLSIAEKGRGGMF